MAHTKVQYGVNEIVQPLYGSSIERVDLSLSQARSRRGIKYPPVQQHPLVFSHLVLDLATPSQVPENWSKGKNARNTERRRQSGSGFAAGSMFDDSRAETAVGDSSGV
jgi:hypothetical protein